MTDLQTDDHPLMTATEAAGKLGMSVKTLMGHVHAGRLRFINVGTAKRKSYRFTPKNLRTFIENQKERAAPCPSTNLPKVHSTPTTSKSTVVAFTALQKPGTKKTPKQSSVS